MLTHPPTLIVPYKVHEFEKHPLSIAITMEQIMTFQNSFNIHTVIVSTSKHDMGGGGGGEVNPLSKVQFQLLRF